MQKFLMKFKFVRDLVDTVVAKDKLIKAQNLLIQEQQSLLNEYKKSDEVMLAYLQKARQEQQAIIDDDFAKAKFGNLVQ